MVSDRPTEWSDFIGQEALKERLQIHIKSAWERKARLDHILLMAPPGAGKTSLARLIADEMRLPFNSFVMPLKGTALKRVILECKGAVLFDEIHRCSKTEQESFLTVIEDGYLQLTNGSRIATNPMFTVIAATTETDKVIKPLFDRFPIKPSFQEYSDLEMEQIVLRMAKKEGLTLETGCSKVLAEAAGGTPRNARSLVLMARDLEVSQKRRPTADQILQTISITAHGLNLDQIRYMKILEKSGPCGLDIICNHLRLPKSVILDYERLLMKKKFITYTKGGRELTQKGFNVVKS